MISAQSFAQSGGYSLPSPVTQNAGFFSTYLMILSGALPI
jgi:hypothetical protein